MKEESEGLAKNPGGRPSLYSLDLAIEICVRLVAGEPLNTICRDEKMPGLSTVYRWRVENAEFRELYARAREDQADTYGDQIIEIADDAHNDWMERHGEDDVGYKENGENVQRSRLRVDARKWYAARLNPKKYGDRQALEHSGPGGKPIEHRNVDPLQDFDPATIAELVRQQTA